MQLKKANTKNPSSDIMEEGRPEEWWGGTEDSGSRGVLTGTPNGGTGEQGQSGPYVQPMMMMQPSNDEATWSMVMGLLTWFSHISSPFLCFTGCIAPFSTIGGVILGHVGLRKASEMNGLNKGMAIAGLVMNYLSIGLYGLLVAGFGLIGSAGL